MTKLQRNNLRDLVLAHTKPGEISFQYLLRIGKDNLTRDEDKESHFCVYFAAFDPKLQEVFMGEHIKSGLWLFNGGHIDFGELPNEALKREIGEEWGINVNLDGIQPSLLTITEITANRDRIKCREHYDIWYFIPVQKDNFNPDEEKLKTEFYKTQWLTLNEARKLVTDPNTLKALNLLQIQ